MNDKSGSEPQVVRFELRVRVDAIWTVTDPATGEAIAWLKPGTETACTWNGPPSPEEVVRRYRSLVATGSEILEEVVVEQRKQLDKVRRGG